MSRMRWSSFAGLCSGGVLIALLTGCEGWHHSMERGMEESQRTNRRMLVQFYQLNDACRQMDDEVFSDEDVQRLLHQRYVSVRLDAWLNQDKVEQYGVVQYPTFLIFRRDGSLAGFRAGEMTADAFRAFLIKHAYN